MDGISPTHVFISYSRSDASFVDQLEGSLQARGYNTWVDRNSTVGGDTWVHSIQGGIDSAQLVLVVLSPEAIKSTWVESEYVYALDQRKRIIPLMHRSCVVPLGLCPISADLGRLMGQDGVLPQMSIVRVIS